jgi:hypothetical protein
LRHTGIRGAKRTREKLHSSKPTSRLIYDLTCVIQYERSSMNYKTISKRTRDWGQRGRYLKGERVR